MALPTPTNLQTLDYSYNGFPFCQVVSKSGITPDTLDISFLGFPFWAILGSISLNIVLNIVDAWKTATGIQINIGDAWKTVTKIQVNIGDAWKTVFG